MGLRRRKGGCGNPPPDPPEPQPQETIPGGTRVLSPPLHHPSPPLWCGKTCPEQHRDVFRGGHPAWHRIRTPDTQRCLIQDRGQLCPPLSIHHSGPAHDATNPSPGFPLVPGAPQHLGTRSPRSSHTDLHPTHHRDVRISLLV